MAHGYYFFPGDYLRDTLHLGWLEDCAYRRLIDLYYTTGKPLRNDREHLMRAVRASEPEQKAAVDFVLTEFFELRADGWHQGKCDERVTTEAKATEARRRGGVNGMKARWGDKSTNSSAITDLDLGPRPTLPYPTLPASVPSPKGSGTARKRASDPLTDSIWAEGTALLGEANDARAFLGRLCKEYGQRLVLQAIGEASAATPAEPRAWLVARCQERRAVTGNKQVALEERNAEVARRWLEKEKANEGR